MPSWAPKSTVGLCGLYLSKFSAQRPGSACLGVPCSIPLQFLASEQLLGHSTINVDLKSHFPRPGSAYGLPCCGSFCPSPHSLS